MKNRILKALAAFGLSVCVLAGSSVVGMAEETPGKTECKEHTWKTTTEYKTECVETTFQHKLPDGTTETLTLCPEWQSKEQHPADQGKRCLLQLFQPDCSHRDSEKR